MATDTQTLKNFIGGDFVGPVDGETEPAINLTAGEVVGHAPLSSAEDVDRAVEFARTAFEGTSERISVRSRTTPRSSM